MSSCKCKNCKCKKNTPEPVITALKKLVDGSSPGNLTRDEQNKMIDYFGKDWEKRLGFK